MSKTFVLPAGQGMAVQLGNAQTVRITNTYGSQVVDTWAFNASETPEFMSMEHTRASLKRLMPGLGESFVTNKRRPILTLLSDSSPGIHDTLIAACDRHRYELLGHIGYHANCTDNLAAAMQAIGMTLPETPVSLEPFHEHSCHSWQSARLVPTCFEARRSRRIPGGDGGRRCIFSLPHGFAARQRRGLLSK
ncbi:uncharacterized protein YcgI (DUF1989 family) [Bradyrhizobium sp. LM4.3]